MHDHGTPLPGDTIWFHHYSTNPIRDDSVFHKSIEELFGPCDELETDNYELTVFKVESVLLKEWNTIKERLQKKLPEYDGDFILGDAAENYCDYYDFECKVRLSGHTIEIVLSGVYGYHNTFLVKLLELRKRLHLAIEKGREELQNEQSIGHSSRRTREEICTSVRSA